MSEPIQATNLALIRARAGRSEELGACLSALLEPSRQSPGCLSYELQRCLGDPDLWLVYGAWVSQEAMEAYFHTTALQTFAKALHGLAASGLDLHSFGRVALPQARPSGEASGAGAVGL
ncbi:MAG: putative quinol monooxygenase [Pseudomonas sp.]